MVKYLQNKESKIKTKPIPEIVLTTLSLGCGLQSSTIAEMIVEGKLPRVDVALFADTGDEPDYVYVQRDYLKERLASVDIPLVTVLEDSIIDVIYRAKGRFASIPAYTLIDGKKGKLRRQCTREYKITPIERYIRQWLLKRGHAKKTKAGKIYVTKSKTKVITHIGFTTSEALRMKPSRLGWQQFGWPLIDLGMSNSDCINWLKKHGLPVPQKSSCRICPFHKKSYWKEMRDKRPGDWQHVIEVDNFLRGEGKKRFPASLRGELYLYKDAIPLEDVDFSAENKQEDFFDLCDEGYCFT